MPNAASKKTTFFSWGLIGLTALLALLALAKLVTFAHESRRPPLSLTDLQQQNQPDAEELKQYLTPDQELAQTLKKSNPFTPPPPPPQPPTVNGVLGDKAFIKGKWYQVGETAEGAKILAVDATSVTIAWQGKEKKLEITAGAPSSGPPSAARPPGPPPTASAPPPAAPGPAPPPRASAGPEDPLAWMGVDLPPALRKKLLEQWNKMNDEQKEQFKASWNAMPDEQKKAAVNAMAAQA